MKLKILSAIAGIAIVSVLLFAATASAFMTPQNSNSNSATNGGTYRWGPFEFGDDGGEGFREGGMMSGWGPFTQSNNEATNAFDDDWGWHE